jgi:hypothetical protein
MGEETGSFGRITYDGNTLRSRQRVPLCAYGVPKRERYSIDVMKAFTISARRKST